MKQLVLVLFLLLPLNLLAKVDAVYFSPNGGTTQALVEGFKLAKKSIIIASYQFTSKPIVEALVEATSRGVKVEVILDSTQTSPPSKAPEVKDKIDIYIDGSHKIFHNKYIIIDNKTLVTGSFNLSANAEFNNAENLLIIKNEPKTVEKYMLNWIEHLGHSKRLK